jgi:hypothetical protein
LSDLTALLREGLAYMARGGASAERLDEIAGAFTDAIFELRELKATQAKHAKICKDWETLRELPRSERANVVAERNDCHRSTVYRVLGLSQRVRQVRG